MIRIRFGRRRAIPDFAAAVLQASPHQLEHAALQRRQLEIIAELRAPSLTLSVGDRDRRRRELDEISMELERVGREIDRIFHEVTARHPRRIRDGHGRPGPLSSILDEQDDN